MCVVFSLCLHWRHLYLRRETERVVKDDIYLSLLFLLFCACIVAVSFFHRGSPAASPSSSALFSPHQATRRAKPMGKKGKRREKVLLLPPLPISFSFWEIIPPSPPFSLLNAENPSFRLLSLPFDTLTGMEKEGERRRRRRSPSYPLLSSFLPLFFVERRIEPSFPLADSPSPPKKNPDFPPLTHPILHARGERDACVPL